MVLLLIIGVALTGLASATILRVLLWPSAASRSMGVPKRVEAYGFEKGSEQKQESPGLRRVWYRFDTAPPRCRHAP